AGRARRARCRVPLRFRRALAYLFQRAASSFRSSPVGV
ncbi:MAG: hypothetical protein AVDCRST_MAG12-2090, partial [uncultured Rubrobacteraceae bacterium]